jgi:hypothetical protein
VTVPVWLVALFDDDDVAARPAIGAGATGNRADVAWRWRVQKLHRDLTSGESERDL